MLTPKTLVINTPQTPQGTNGFITVPASSNVLDKFLECNPSLS